MEASVARGVSGCPFLHIVRQDSGHQVAEQTAQTAVAAIREGRCPFHAGSALREVFESAHGREGPLPLRSSPHKAAIDGDEVLLKNGELTDIKRDADPGDHASLAPAQCPVHRSRLEPWNDTSATVLHSNLASISFSASFLSDWFDNWRRQRAKRNGRGKRKPRRKAESSSSIAGQSLTASESLSIPTNRSASFNFQPMVGLGMVTKAGHLQCPPPIIAMRKALAKTPLCSMLRPQHVAFKLAACGVLSALANIPPGMVKTHLEKFSPGWFVAIHVSIPFVAALRKAVVMPKYALVVTIGGAIGGQMLGGMLERMRLEHRTRQQALLADGSQPADEVPIMCNVLKALMNPWDDIEGEGVPCNG